MYLSGHYFIMADGEMEKIEWFKEKDEQKALDVMKSLCQARIWRRADEMVSYYRDDAVMLPPGRPIIKGHEAVRSIFQEVFDSGSVEIHNHSCEVSVDGNTAVVFGSYSLSGNATRTDGNTFCVLRKDAKTGEWKITHDIWN